MGGNYKKCVGEIEIDYYKMVNGEMNLDYEKE